jgi:hypothetical protein
MSEHEKAAVVHEKANNGQSSVIHQQQAKSIAARSPRINPQLHLSDPHLTPKSLAYAPVRERFFKPNERLYLCMINRSLRPVMN